MKMRRTPMGYAVDDEEDCSRQSKGVCDEVKRYLRNGVCNLAHSVRNKKIRF